MKKYKNRITEEKGIYVLVLRCDREQDIRVGSFGTISVRPGYYSYVGSAYGGGGLRSRLGRHLKTAKKCRWHIDYIRRHMRAVSVWITTEGREAEHSIAQRFISGGGEVHMRGFGSSDCTCEAHLFYTPDRPEPFLPEYIDIS